MNAELIDIHAHLTYSPLAEQLELVLARAKACGVSTVITIGTDPDDSRAAVALADKIPSISAAIGIHPHAADKYSNVDQIKPLLGHPKIIGIGETGLDYHYQLADRVNQQRLFHSHLELAHETQLPVIVHCREAFDDTLDILQSVKSGLRGVFHCFSGSQEQARQVLDLGWFISFSGTVTFKNAQDLRRTAKFIGVDHILIETDCPFLSPEPVRKNRTNEPANVLYTAKLLAELFNLSLEEFSRFVRQNAVKLFGL
ncbi:MAG: TatD family hydrolase [Phycisphaerae bacterium]